MKFSLDAIRRSFDSNYQVEESELNFEPVRTVDQDQPRRFGQARKGATLEDVQQWEPATKVGFGYAVMFIGTRNYGLLSQHFSDDEIRLIVHCTFVKAMRELRDAALLAREQEQAFKVERAKLLGG